MFRTKQPLSITYSISFPIYKKAGILKVFNNLQYLILLENNLKGNYLKSICIERKISPSFYITYQVTYETNATI